MAKGELVCNSASLKAFCLCWTEAQTMSLQEEKMVHTEHKRLAVGQKLSVSLILILNLTDP